MVRYGLSFCLAIAVFALFSVPCAKADDLFTYELGSNTYTWVLPSSPVISSGNFSTDPSTGYFEVLEVPYSVNGISQTLTGFEGVAFYPTGNEGGFALFVGGSTILNVFGTQLYTGSEDAPTFLLGDFPLNNGSPDGPLDTLTIETAPGTNATPEPSSLLLLAGGLFSFLGLAWKRRIAAQSIS